MRARRMVGVAVGCASLGCGGLFSPPPEVPLPPPGASLVSRASPRTSDRWTEEIAFRFDEKTDASAGLDRIRTVFERDGWTRRELPFWEDHAPGWDTNRFGKGGRWVEVSRARDNATWIAHVDAPNELAQPIPETIEISGGTTESPADGLKRPLVCDFLHPSLYPDGHVEVPYFASVPDVVWQGRWSLSADGTLAVEGKLVSSPPDDTDSPATWQSLADDVPFTCAHARLWTESTGRHALLCSDRLLPCEPDSGYGHYVEVRDAGGGADAVDKVAHVAGRAFDEPALSVPAQVHVGDPGKKQPGLRVIWGPATESTPRIDEDDAIALASLLERDLDVTAEILEDDHETAPLVVEVGSPARQRLPLAPPPPVAPPKPPPPAPPPAVARGPEVTLCAADEDIYFSCGVKPRAYVSLCGSGGRVQYRYGKPGAPELVWPTDGSPTAFGYSEVEGAQFLAERVSFEKDGYEYTVNETEHAVEPDMDFTGVTVWKGSDVVARLPCTHEKIGSDWEGLAKLVPGS